MDLRFPKGCRNASTTNTNACFERFRGVVDSLQCVIVLSNGGLREPRFRVLPLLAFMNAAAETLHAANVPDMGIVDILRGRKWYTGKAENCGRRTIITAEGIDPQPDVSKYAAV